MSLPLPTIRARLVERFIFNFRLPLEQMSRHLPSGLRPLAVSGSAIASFCILDLDDVTFGPFPERLGLRNVHCAHRLAVIDDSTGSPAVYVDERNTSSRFGAFVTALGFPGRHSRVDVRLDHCGEGWDIEVGEATSPWFSASVRRGDAELRSELFDSLDAFAAFIAQGVRSYCPAVKADTLNIVDLHKEDSRYEPLAVDHVHDALLVDWLGDGEDVTFDSAVRTAGGSYRWSYCGQRAARPA